MTVNEKQAVCTKDSRRLWSEVSRFVAKVLIRFGVEQADQEEVVQEVCIKLLRCQSKGYTLSGSSGIHKQWIAVVAKNVAKDYYRSAKGRLTHASSCWIFGDQLIGVREDDETYLPAPEKEVVEPDLKAAVMENLASLGERHKLTMQLYSQGCSYAAIAQITGSEVGTVRSRVHYGKKKLRKQLIAFK